MSNRQLEEQAEERQAVAVAAALGISVEDLNEMDWELEAAESNEGALHGYNVNFAEGSDPDVLAKIKGLNDGRWVRIGPNF